MIRVLFINNLGGGYADYVDVAENTTVEKFFSQKMAGCEAGDYLIRVNRLPAPKDQVLQNNDRITITPTKIDGARSVRS